VRDGTVEGRVTGATVRQLPSQRSESTNCELNDVGKKTPPTRSPQKALAVRFRIGNGIAIGVVFGDGSFVGHAGGF
jgi:hypothetical protein